MGPATLFLGDCSRVSVTSSPSSEAFLLLLVEEWEPDGEVPCCSGRAVAAIFGVCTQLAFCGGAVVVVVGGCAPLALFLRAVAVILGVCTPMNRCGRAVAVIFGFCSP